MVEAPAQKNQVAERKRLLLVATASTCKPCTNCDQDPSTQAKHQTLISSKEESSDAELEDRHLWQVFPNRHPCKRCARRDVYLHTSLNLKQKAPHLSKPLTWIRVCPNEAHHQQAIAFWGQLDFLRFPMLFRLTLNRYLEAF